MRKQWKDRKRWFSGALAALILSMSVLPCLPHLNAYAYMPGDTALSQAEGWDHFCIDSYELLGEKGGILGQNEWYQYVLPSTRLSDLETAYLFWAMVSLYHGLGKDPNVTEAVSRINSQAGAMGIMGIGQAVTEKDLKEILHSASAKNRYPWLADAVKHADQYLTAAGLLGAHSRGSLSDRADTGTVGGIHPPALLQGHTDVSSALEVGTDTMGIFFDAGGADRDFIHRVPLEFSADGIAWSSTAPGGWSCQKTDTGILFSNPNKNPPRLLIRFKTEGTAYAGSSGSFHSAKEVYDQCLQLWVCVQCNNSHVIHPKTSPLEWHQRMAKLELANMPVDYYAVIGGSKAAGAEGGINFRVYRHEEEMTSTYNVQLGKYDHETGKPLEGAGFAFYERFDDRGQIDREKDGPVHLYEGGASYKSYHTDDPVVWADFRRVGSVVTDENGHAEKTVNHGYHYDKTFCDGHTAPGYIPVPDEEYDEEGNLENGDEIAAAQRENMRLSDIWLNCFAACSAQAKTWEGVHFHWLMDSVDEGEIRQLAGSGGSPGESPDAGPTTSADGSEAYEKSGCRQDCEDTYEKFIALRYSYTFVEIKARDGYILHDVHPDDIPVEIITTDSSEHGAVSSFGGEYGRDIAVTETTGRSASQIREERAAAAAFRMDTSEQGAETKEEKPTLMQTIRRYAQKVLSLFLNKKDETYEEETELFNDLATPENWGTAISSASASNAKAAAGSASASDAESAGETASMSDAAEDFAAFSLLRMQVHFSRTSDGHSDSGDEMTAAEPGEEQSAGAGKGSSLFTEKYQAALLSASEGAPNEPGPTDHYSHCNGGDGEADAWRIYDHRTEGEIHINKRDMELQNGEGDGYDSYGDTQGDGTLEGAVYGLFAAEDLVHPDGKTGIVYRAGNLAAVASTDKNGDASFLAFTVAPGHSYQYAAGNIEETDDGWAGQAPGNLYEQSAFYNDYTADGEYVTDTGIKERTYPDNKNVNGNGWIGRPLLMGEYYIKELTRSEGYELSIGNRQHPLTNRGQDTETTIPKGEGYAVVTSSLRGEGQIREDAAGTYGDPDYNELFFSVTSGQTGTQGFDLVFSNLPRGAKLYRRESGTKTIQVPVGTGEYEKMLLTNSDGSPRYLVAEQDHQYLKYDENGIPMTRERPISCQAEYFPVQAVRGLNTEKIQEVLAAPEGEMSAEEVLTVLASEYTAEDLDFVRSKVEKALKKNGKTVLHAAENQVPVQTLTLAGKKEDGEPLQAGDLILSILDYYNEHGFFDCGGIDTIAETEDGYVVTVYAGAAGNPAGFFVQGGDPETEGVFYKTVECESGDSSSGVQYLYATYTKDGKPAANAPDPFGRWENLTLHPAGDRYFADAVLITDVIADEEGNLKSRTSVENIYYEKGEMPRNENGDLIQACEYREKTVLQEQEAVVDMWTELPVSVDEQAAHIDSTYIDSYGTAHEDAEGQTYDFRIVVPEREFVLTDRDIDVLGPDTAWNTGDIMAASIYYLKVRQMRVRACLDYRNQSLTGDNSYVKTQLLVYPGQEYIWQDGAEAPGTGTRLQPVGIEERVIKQQIRITKDIEKTSYNNTNSYGQVHEDWFTRLFGGFLGGGIADAAAEKLDNFRFKAYLKSNLERLYRTEDGCVIWQNRHGTELETAEVLKEAQLFPGLVRKIYTKVLHQTRPLWKNSEDAVLANKTLYGFTSGQIHEQANHGYTAVLETTEQLVEDGDGTRTVKAPNYDKFFDAMAVANHDKWDDAAPTYTSWRPFDSAVLHKSDDESAAWIMEQNAKVSDAVRQFAIDWYLDDEIAKRVHPAEKNAAEKENADGAVLYSDELYDEALYAALGKAENYLKPFFAYDLDEIYAIAWDSEDQGGQDRDRTTLAADENGGSTCYGTSEYLPYGTYVVAEQQPGYAQLDDFANRHYEIDRPKEAVLPAGSDYRYDADMPWAEQERRYQIRFHEENQVLQAHNGSGDFELYPYGMEIDCITNGEPEMPGSGDYFALTQSEFRPYKNYYNEADDRTAGQVRYYLTEGQSGRAKIAPVYRYSSVSEQAGTADGVPFPGSVPETEDNVPGTVYQDQVRTMHGMQTAYHGRYAPMLVPWSIMAPEQGETSSGSDQGFGDIRFRNRYYTTKLRLEKLDAWTHENILHDGAIFAIYAAKREDTKDGEGTVMFYEKPETISGTREFLESMRAEDIRPMARKRSFFDWLTGKEYGPGNLYTGVVPAGTPVCDESEKIVLGDGFGNQTGVFQSYSTVLDGFMRDEDTDKGRRWQSQTVGYLETPQPLGAGVYVIAEEKAPMGYVRTAPVAVEVYSDKVTYYMEGNKDSRVLAAVYEYPSDHQTANKNKPQDIVHAARVYVENAPVRLLVEKLKEPFGGISGDMPDQTVTYKVSGRIDGSLTEIGGRQDYVYAYENGEYLGYAWKKGTLEMLAARKAAGEAVELIYDGNTFAGYGYVTRTLETADDANPYVVGARMTLFDAVELTPSGDQEDHGYEGLVVERSHTGNVTRMYIREGYAGDKVEYVKKKDDFGQEYVAEYQAGADQKGQPVMITGNIWGAVTIPRPDTDILYYDLDHLDVLRTESVGSRKIIYGYDQNHRKVPVHLAEADHAGLNRTDVTCSLFAFKDGVPYLEFAGGDLTKLAYSAKDKILTVDPETYVYHVDSDGNRDALVDPHTGMAYVTERAEDGTEKILVWPVNIRRDESGNILSRDKITTSRAAVISGYISGTWKSAGSGESHQEITVKTNDAGRNLNREVLTDKNNGSFEKELNPIYDSHGLPEYYQRAEETYDKGTELYDRNDKFVRYQDSDNLEAYNQNAYRIQENERLYDGDAGSEDQDQKKLYHRLGEGYVLENSWMTSDRTPNDPFDSQMTDGQPDLLLRVPAGTYIMEELAAPDGYLKGMPKGITVAETVQLQYAAMTDRTTKVEFSKIDGAPDESLSSGRISELGSYGYAQVPGAVLALYKAKRVYTSDLETYPNGYYLKKTEAAPFQYASTESTPGNEKVLTAQWTTGAVPVYAEGIPAGDYILEEIQTPAGFVTSAPMEVEITDSPQVQCFCMYDDHTKVEIEKYHVEGKEEKLLEGAGFALYPAVMDAEGKVVYQDGQPQYQEDQEIDSWITRDMTGYRAFVPEFEAMYRDYGVQPGAEIRWNVGDKAYHASCVLAEALPAGMTDFPTRAVLVFRTDEGADIRISVYGETADRRGRDFVFEYQFDYRRLPKVHAYAASYLTLEGKHRIDYLPAGNSYVLREVQAPQGFARAHDRVIQVADSREVSLYRIENQEGRLLVSKTLKTVDGELAGAHLALYRADEAGAFIQDAEHLAADWLTGADGVYTEADEINGKIPEGYQKGDQKPHEVCRLDDGIYWLAELESPDYLNTFEPVRVEYRQGDEIRIIRTEDTMAVGELTIHKSDKKGNPLTGAAYELTAYRQSDLRTPVLCRVLSGTGDTIQLTDLTVGEIGEGGRIIPYRYQLRELTPPEGYAVNTEIFTWQFAPDRQGVSYAFGERAKKEITVSDDRTRIIIEKKDFDALGDDNTEGAFVRGAKLALYEVIGRDEQDELVYDGDRPTDIWMTEDAHVIEGLIAGHSYLLKELETPEGYYLMKPVLLTMSLDGRKIASVSNQLSTITIHTLTAADSLREGALEYPDLDSIRSVTVKGRYAVSVEHVLTDSDGNELARMTVGAGASPGTGKTPGTEGVPDRILLQSGQDGNIVSGEACILTETTRYSDGSEVVTGRMARTLYLDENGQCSVPIRTAEYVMLTLEHADGTAIDSFRPSELVQEKTIANNVLPEHPRITMRNPGGRPGDVLNPRKAVLAEVTFLNTAHTPADMEIIVTPDANTEIIDAGAGKLEHGRLIWTTEDMQPFTIGSLPFVTSVEETALSSSLTVTVRCNGNTYVTTKTVPVLQKNRLTIFHELTGSGKRLYAEAESRFRVRLFHGKTGEELKGSYAYQGSRSGKIRSGETIALAGNEFITIDPDIYRDVSYEVVREQDGQAFEAWGESSGESGDYVVFTRSLPDTRDRERFRKGESYVLTETTGYTDGSVLESNRLQITLGEYASVEGIQALDRKTRAVLSKIGISGEKELPGCEMELRDLDGNLIDAWISGEEPHELTGVLVPGETYILSETNPAPGYSYAEEIRFTVNEDGMTERVVMVDRPTDVTVIKTDTASGQVVTGALLQILDEQGAVKESWISDTSAHEISGRLNAGQTYYLHEEKAPSGYRRAEDAAFVVPKNGEKLELNFANSRIRGGGGSDTPHTPTPQKPEKIGRITVHYTPRTTAAGSGIFTGTSYAGTIQGTWIRILSPTGDESHADRYLLLALLSLLGAAGGYFGHLKCRK